MVRINRQIGGIRMTFETNWTYEIKLVTGKGGMVIGRYITLSI
jgi:hypothetical protein